MWYGRDLIAGALFASLTLFGFCLMGELLPYSPKTRARWERSRQLDMLYPSHRYRNTLWVGLGLAAPKIWRACTGGEFHPLELLIPAVFIFAGIVAYGIWHFRYGRTPDRNVS